MNVYVDASKVASNMTMNVHVTGFQSWLWRKRIGVWLIRLAAYVMGVGIEIKD